MYMDAVVFSGLAVVGLMVAFFGGVVYFLRKDAKEHSHEK